MLEKHAITVLLAFFGLSYVPFPPEDPYVTTLFTRTGKICVGKMNVKYYSQC